MRLTTKLLSIENINKLQYVFALYLLYFFYKQTCNFFFFLCQYSKSHPHPTRPVLKTSSPAMEPLCPKENPFILVPSSKTR